MLDNATSVQKYDVVRKSLRLTDIVSHEDDLNAAALCIQEQTFDG